MKNLWKAVLFSAGFLVALVVVSYILRPYSGSASRKNLCGFYAEEDQSLDVVFVGASSCFAYWEAPEAWKKYGFTSYDFATGTMPPQMLKYCLKEIRKTQSPKLYVIDLRPFAAAEEGYYLDKSVMSMDHDVPLRNVCDNFKYSLNRFQMIQECVPDEYDKIPYYIDIIKYHTEWYRLLDLQSLKFGLNSSHDSLKGFRLNVDVAPVRYKDFSKVKKGVQMSERLDKILYDLLDYCKDEGLQPLFLVNAYCQTRAEKKMYNYISQVLEKYGYDFLNTNDYFEEIGLDPETDFYDRSHVNVFGADKYTEFVGNYLMEHYSFEDKRGQEKYAQWDRDYEVWKQEADEVKAGILELLETKRES